MSRHALILPGLLLACATEPKVERPADQQPVATASQAPSVAVSAAPEVEEGPSFQVDAEAILASYETKYTWEGKYADRAHNIGKIVERLHGTIIPPGEEFSFNETVGPRTEDRGYRKAPIYFAGIKTQGMGGGTCQVSSTLYAATMFAHLTILQRTAHTRPSDYIPRGLDATVDYGVLDLRFRNQYDAALGIEAAVIDDDDKKKILRISIVGRTPDFTVKRAWYSKKAVPFEVQYIDTKYHRGRPRRKQRGKDGLPGASWWVFKDSEGKVIDRQKVYSMYKPVNEVWYRNPETCEKSCMDGEWKCRKKCKDDTDLDCRDACGKEFLQCSDRCP
jgi:hypothetical protein